MWTKAMPWALKMHTWCKLFNSTGGDASLYYLLDKKYCIFSIFKKYSHLQKIIIVILIWKQQYFISTGGTEDVNYGIKLRQFFC